MLGPAGGEVHGERRSSLRRGLEVFRENRLAVVGIGLVVFFLLFCFVGPLLYHTDQTTSNLAISNEPPSRRTPARHRRRSATTSSGG